MWPRGECGREVNVAERRVHGKLQWCEWMDCGDISWLVEPATGVCWTSKISPFSLTRLLLNYCLMCAAFYGVNDSHAIACDVTRIRGPSVSETEVRDPTLGYPVPTHTSVRPPQCSGKKWFEGANNNLPSSMTCAFSPHNKQKPKSKKM